MLKMRFLSQKYLLSKFLLISSLMVVVLLPFPQTGQAGIGDGLTENEKKQLWTRLKKINVRLSELETKYLKAFQESQEIFLLQIQELQKVIPQLQGTLEQNAANLATSVASMNSKIDEIGNQTQKDRNQLFEEWGKIREELRQGMEGVRQGIAQDVEYLAKKNQDLLTLIQSENQSALDKVNQEIAGQAQQLTNNQAVIREELIPAIAEQGKLNVQAMSAKLESMVTQLEEFQTRQTNELTGFQKRIEDSFAQTNSKNQGLIEIVQKSISLQKQANEGVLNQVTLINTNLNTVSDNQTRADESILKQVALVSKNLNTVSENQTKANENIITTGEGVFGIRQILPNLGEKIDYVSKNFGANENLVASNIKVLDEKTGKIGENLKALNSSFNNLGQSVTTLNTNFATLERQGQINAEKVLERNQEVAYKVVETVGRAMAKAEENTKTVESTTITLAKIIEILQRRSEQTDAQAAALDAKLDGAEQKVQANKNDTDLANQKLTKLIEILKTLLTTQGKMEKSIQAQAKSGKQGIPTIMLDVLALKEEQVAIKEALFDLRRKANVNLTRSQDIKKSLQKLLSKK